MIYLIDTTTYLPTYLPTYGICNSIVESELKIENKQNVD